MRLRHGLFVSFLLCASLAWSQGVEAPPAVTADYVAALVNSDPITDGELRAQIQILDKQLREQGRNRVSPAELRASVLERLINERIQLQLAEQMGIRADEAALDQAEKSVAAQNQLSVAGLRQNLERDGISWSVFRRQLGEQIALGRLREREIDARVKVSEADIDRALAEQQAANANIANQTINAAQILIALPESATEAQLVAAQARVQAVGERLKAGSNFEALVAELSDGDRKNGGQLGLRRADRYPDLFLAALRDLPVGGVSKPVRSGAGFHILKLLERRLPAAASAITQTRARHILLAAGDGQSPAQAQEQLQDVRKAIVAGQTTFESAAQALSQDGSAAQGGDLGWANPGMFVPEFEQAMDSLREGEISAPLVSRFGVHLIQVLERRRVEPTQEQQREQVRKQLRAQKMDERFVSWLSELRARAFVEIREP